MVDIYVVSKRRIVREEERYLNFRFESLWEKKKESRRKEGGRKK